MTPTMSMFPMQAMRSGRPVMPLASSSANPTARYRPPCAVQRHERSTKSPPVRS